MKSQLDKFQFSMIVQVQLLFQKIQFFIQDTNMLMWNITSFLFKKKITSLEIMSKKKDVIVEKIHTEIQRADILTKPLVETRFKKLCGLLGLLNPDGDEVEWRRKGYPAKGESNSARCSQQIKLNCVTQLRGNQTQLDILNRLPMQREIQLPSWGRTKSSWKITQPWYQLTTMTSWFAFYFISHVYFSEEYII